VICPSILSADFSSLKETLKSLKAAGIEVVHFDVMDNHFVPNLTFGAKFIGDLRKHSDLFFDAHLMIDNPEKDIPLYLEAGADLITVHFEATGPEQFESMSRAVREKGKKIGVSLKPGTPVSALKPFLSLFDLVLVMTVEPGFGGQKLIEACVDKISQLASLKGESDFIIQVDGGINRDNLREITHKGADWFVLGSAFFKETDFKFYLKYLNEIQNERF
jgi:ribulose-phosphate 3-epimerase